MTHIARGLDSDGALLLDIVVNGHIRLLPSHADVSIKVNKMLMSSKTCWFYTYVYIQDTRHCR